ncbi:MAG: LPS assembly lipoprotein LptE [bacterium]
MATYKFFIAFLSLIISIYGCGYKSRSDMLGHIDTITISKINNQSQEYGLDEDLTKALKQEFSRHWGEGLDSLFTATIKDYELIRISFDQSNRPEQYRLVISLSFVFEDLKRNKVVRNESNYEKFYDFYVVEGRSKPPETLTEAKQNLIKETAEDIVSSIVEEW